jgi:hypothetical protein
MIHLLPAHSRCSWRFQSTCGFRCNIAQDVIRCLYVKPVKTVWVVFANFNCWRRWGRYRTMFENLLQCAILHLRGAIGPVQITSMSGDLCRCRWCQGWGRGRGRARARRRRRLEAARPLDEPGLFMYLRGGVNDMPWLGASWHCVFAPSQCPVAQRHDKEMHSVMVRT